MTDKHKEFAMNKVQLVDSYRTQSDETYDLDAKLALARVADALYNNRSIWDGLAVIRDLHAKAVWAIHNATPATLQCDRDWYTMLRLVCAGAIEDVLLLNGKLAD